MARILNFTETGHRRLASLLPWYLNGTLSAQEHDELEAHLSQCTQCRAELEEMREIAGILRTDVSDIQADIAFRRIAGRLGGMTWTGRLEAWFSDHVPAWSGRVVLAAQFALIAVLAVVLWQKPQPHDYRVLADATHGQTDRLFVRFGPAATEAGIRAALMRADARIVDGPTPDGVYVVQPVGQALLSRDRLVHDPVVAHVQVVEVH
ncbi:MAG: hypothetical protein GC151_18385 [Betaproteobacteria bacterium]|nr:hypothetical protein [Betaproteobacteria bacterium]